MNCGLPKHTDDMEEFKPPLEHVWSGWGEAPLEVDRLQRPNLHVEPFIERFHVLQLRPLQLH